MLVLVLSTQRTFDRGRARSRYRDGFGRQGRTLRKLFTIFLYFRTPLVDLMFRGDIFSSQVTDGVAPAAGVVVYPDRT